MQFTFPNLPERYHFDPNPPAMLPAQQVQPPVQPWVTSQAVATFLGAILVLCGVAWTLRSHAHRLRTEQLAKREADREKMLQGKYGEFASAAFQFIREMAQAGSEQHDIDSADRGDAEEEGWDFDAALSLWKAKRDRHREAAVPYRSAASAAFGTLLVLNDTDERLAQTKEILEWLFLLDQNSAFSDEERHYNRLKAFCSDIGFGLETDYLHQLAAAESRRTQKALRFLDAGEFGGGQYWEPPQVAKQEESKTDEQKTT
jgi:hypothetical protein